MALPDVYCLFNRARGTALVSPDDLIKVRQSAGYQSKSTLNQRWLSSNPARGRPCTSKPPGLYARPTVRLEREACVK
eukprot:910758-Prorocentrum_minimum.AAC.2